MEHKIINFSLALGAMAILFLSLFNPTKAFGYNDTDNTKVISIDKKVRSTDDSQYYDNIESSKKTFYENDVVEFQIEVKNIGTQVVYNINIKDMLPKYLSLVFNPGKFDSDQNIVEWNIDKLEANESKNYLIRAKINNSTKLNVSTKQTNKAEACGAGQCDVDTASYFIGKVTVPATGASDIVIKTILVALLAIGGFSLRKFVREY